jgi:two-component system vancomycin resistance associated response regulator VraR
VQKQVLIADDNRVVRGIIKSFLTRRRDLAVCGEAANGREAVEKARALKPDLVLLDLLMPDMNGVEAASVLKQTMPEIPIVLFTMYTERVGQHLTAAIGIDAVLSKPDGLTNLAKVVDILLPRDSEPSEFSF